MEHIKDVLDEILSRLDATKPVLTFEEGCKYCGISKSKMYKHTSSGEIAFSKPGGKLIYFNREDLEQWMLSNRQSSNEEKERIANTYSVANSRKSNPLRKRK